MSQSNVQDVSQISSVQVTPRPKQRAFPRTNPAYVGLNRREGAPSYKRINIEQPQAPTAIYNQRFYGAQSPPNTDNAAAYAHEGQQQRGFERSDSDASHSSYGMNRVLLKDAAMSSSYYKPAGSGGGGGGAPFRELHDSHSSQGSLRTFGDSLSSQGSAKSSGSRDLSSGSGRRSRDDSRESRDSPHHHHHHHHQHQHHAHDNQHSPRSRPQAPARSKHQQQQQHATTATEQSSFKPSSSVRRPVEVSRHDQADYANVTTASQSPAKLMTLSDLLSKRESDQEKFNQMTSSSHTDNSLEMRSAESLDLRSGDSLRSTDSLSTVDSSSQRHDVASHLRSRLIQDSSGGKHKYEGTLSYYFSNVCALNGDKLFTGDRSKKLNCL